MIGGIIGDIIGSVYEAHQWTRKDLNLIQPFPIDKKVVIPNNPNSKWTRSNYSWTDDTLCTLGLYKSYINKTDFTTTLQSTCIKHMNDSVGFGKNFRHWLDNPIPYESYANGSIMRIGFIPFLNIPLSQKLTLGYDVTKISHNHIDSYQAVQDYIVLCNILKDDINHENYNKNCLLTYLNNQQFDLTVNDMHQQNIFELNAMYTLLQAVRIVYESNTFEDALRNSFYVGGDSDTLATVAGNIASIIYPVQSDMMNIAEMGLATNKELYDLVAHFNDNYWLPF